jgi:hypothetical protein
VRVVDAPVHDDVPPPPPSTRHASFGGLAGFAGAGGGFGARVAFDLWSRGPWSLGGSLDVSQIVYEPMLFTSKQYTFVDMTTMAFAAGTWRSGRWSARSVVGLGMMTTLGTLNSDVGMSQFASMTAAMQLAEFGGVDLGNGWGIEAGPVFTLFSQTGSDGYSRANSLLVFAGMTHRM